MNEIRLIAFDLDGTFLRDDKSIPEENMKALEYAASKGVEIVPATGRLYKGIPPEIMALPFIRYYILINGSKIYDSKEDRVVSRAEIPVEDALAFYDYADTVPCIYDCYVNDTGRMSRSMYDVMDRYFPDHNYLKLMKKLREPVDDLKETVRREGVPLQKMQLFFADLDERTRQYVSMPERFPDLIFSTSLASNIEINYKTAGKGKAIRRLCAELGIPPESSLAFGDGLNDMEMIEMAGTGAVMSNGDEELLRIADIVVGNNNDAGVAKAIYEMI